MRMLPLAVIVGAFACGTDLSAQDKPLYTVEAMLRRIGAATAVADANNCVLPDKAERPVNTTVTFEGRTFRCVEVLDENLQRRGVAWSPPKATYTRNVMLERIRPGSAPITDPADAVNCVLTGKPESLVDSTVAVDGRTYRCVEVADPNFQRRGVAWTPAS